MSNFPFNYSAIPPYMRDGLVLYIEEGVPPGNFLGAVLEGDLFRACDAADINNMPVIPVYAAWLYNKAPAGCFGSRARVDAWIEKGGLGGEVGINYEDSFGDVDPEEVPPAA